MAAAAMSQSVLGGGAGSFGGMRRAGDVGGICCCELRYPPVHETCLANGVLFPDMAHGVL